MIRRRTEDAQQSFAFLPPPCAHRTTTLRWREMHHGRVHLGRYCEGCRCWLGWVRQDPGILFQAPPRPQR